MKNYEDISDDLLLTELHKRLGIKNELLLSQASLIDEMKELNTKLKDAEKVKSDFLSNIRNEINNPFTSIIGLAQQLISAREMDIEKVRKIAYLINKEAFSLDFQLKNIFAAAEIEAGELNPKPVTIDLMDIIQDQVYYFKEKASRKDVGIKITNGIKDYRFISDPYMIKIIVMNLISNAVEFSTDGKEIEIRTAKQNEGFVVTVIDKGKGIEKNNLKYVFDRFRQTDHGSAKAHQGHGLGLSIVKEFVESLNGTLSLNSVKNKGTTVTVYLPSFNKDQIEGNTVYGDDIFFGNGEIL